MHFKLKIPKLVWLPFVAGVFGVGLLGSDSHADKPGGVQADKWKNVGKIVKAPADTPVWTDAKKARAEFAGFEFMGEYTQGQSAIQVVPAEGRFYLSIYQGGLPGAGWDGGAIEHQWLGLGAIKKRLDGWKKVDRSAALEFPAAPDGATVLFDGKKGKHWKSVQVVDGLLQAGAKTKRAFTNFKLHAEFMTPLKPALPLSHPGRGNSGIFALATYEVQVMDTFALDPNPDAWKATPILKKPDTWCGSIYGIRPPAVNVCLPPLAWQTIDIEFTAAEFDGEEKTTNAVMEVYLNGVLVQKRIELPSGTGGGPSGPRPEVAQGPILIQKHGSPVMYRNIWMVEPKSKP